MTQETMFWAFMGTAAIAVLTIVVLIYKIGRWTGIMEASKEAFDKFVEKVEEEFREIHKEIREIRNDIKIIFRDMPGPTLVRGSPIQLTELGEEIKRDLTVQKWATSIARNLVSEMREKAPCEIQNFCFEYVKNKHIFSHEENEKVQTCAYEKGIDVNAVPDVYAVELRDCLLRQTGRSPD